MATYKRPPKAPRYCSPERAASADSLSVYFSEIARYPILSVEDERRLTREYRRSNDPQIARALTTSNLRFVVKIAKEYRSFGLAMSDLIQEGNLGLMKAVEKFDPSRGIRLISYAVWWIRAHIRDHILRSWSLVRLGTTQAQRKLFFCLPRAKRDLEMSEGRLGEPPTTERMAEAMNVRPEEILEMEQRTAGRDLSLDAPVYDDGGSSRLDFLTSTGPGPEEEVSARDHQRQMKARVKTALECLDRRELAVVKSRTMSDEPVTLDVLGRRLGFSAERARQLEIRARDKLRSALSSLAA